VNCLNCRNRRCLARGLTWFWWTRRCYYHDRRRRAVLHIAGRISLALVVFAGFLGFFAKVVWELRALVGR
jgi:hypothetical protein